MNANSIQAETVFEYVARDLEESDCVTIRSNARVLRRYCTQTALVFLGGRAIVIFWMSDHWSYSCITGKRTLREMEGIIGALARYLFGSDRPPLVIVGRVNRKAHT